MIDISWSLSILEESELHSSRQRRTRLWRAWGHGGAKGLYYEESLAHAVMSLVLGTDRLNKALFEQIADHGQAAALLVVAEIVAYSRRPLLIAWCLMDERMPRHGAISIENLLHAQSV